MNKALSFILGIALFGSVALPVFADDGTIPEADAVPTESVLATTTPETAEPVATTTASTSPNLEVNETIEEILSITSDHSEEVLVKFKEDEVDLSRNSGLAESEALAADEDLAVEEHIEDSNISVLSTDGQSLEKVIERLEDNPLVEYAEPNYQRSFAAIATDDPDRGVLWALENTGQSVDGVAGTIDADIDAPEAWLRTLGTSTTVAVIDNGVLYTHPDLSANMWNGTACKSDTGSALGGCNHGYYFATTSSSTSPLPSGPYPTGTHGTHVAGIIAARMNNAEGTIGVAPSTKIMAIKFDLYVSSEIQAINFARENGAKVINASYGGTGFSQAEADAIEDFTDSGGIFIAAAGNDGTSNDSTPIYPASHTLPGIVSVLATDQNDARASFSNYGAVSVDLGAPGVNIYSTITTNGTSTSYDYKDGTSMAAPHVAGVAALIWSLYPSLTVAQVKDALLAGGDSISGLSAITVSGKRLNARRALLRAEDPVPPVITLSGASSVTLTVGDTYSEAGASAFDAFDNATTTVVIGGDTVNTASAGTYTVTYTSTDSHENVATAERTVIIQAASSGGGGGGGGGGGSSKKSKSKSKTKAKTPVRATVTKTAAPAATVANPTRSLLPAAPQATTPSTPVPSFIFTRLLTIGSMGPDVTALQQALTRAGVYTGPVTGYFGPLTAAGVRAFQAARGLEAVGVVGPMTRALLNTGI